MSTYLAATNGFTLDLEAILVIVFAQMMLPVYFAIPVIYALVKLNRARAKDVSKDSAL